MKGRNNISLERIIAYLRDQLSNRQRHEFEKEAMRDAFDEEAMEGLEQLSADELEEDLSQLRSKLAQRTTQKKRLIVHPAFRVAAVIVVLLGVGVLIKISTDTITLETQLQEIAEEKEIPDETGDTMEITGSDENEKQTSVPSKPVKEQQSSESATQQPIAEIDNEKMQKVLQSQKQTEESVQTALPVAEKPTLEYIEATSDTEAMQAVRRLRLKERDTNAGLHTTFSESGNYLVRGKILSEDGEPLPGVNIVEAGTGNGTITDVDGNFMFTMQDSARDLNISFIGYQEMVIDPSKLNDSPVILTPDLMALEEVVVVGYGTVKKSESTGAVSTVEVNDDEHRSYEKPVPPTNSYDRFESALRDSIRTLDNDELKQLDQLIIRVKVLENGQLGDFKYRPDVSPKLRDEIERIMHSMGRWTPATMDNANVYTRVRLKVDLKEE